MANPLPEFDRFVRVVQGRCQRGADTYGSGSFTKPLPAGIQEIMDELADTAGWAWVQWVRLYRVQQEALAYEPVCLLCYHRETLGMCHDVCGGWTCTRSPNHSGGHVACAESVHRVAAWNAGDATPMFTQVKV